MEEEYGNAIEVVDIDEVLEDVLMLELDSTTELEETVSEFVESTVEDVTPIYESYFPDETTEVIASPTSKSLTIPVLASASDVTISATSKNGSARIKWHPYSWNPFRMQLLPHSMWIDFIFKYTGSGKSKRFDKIKEIVANSTGFPSSWKKTTSPYYSFYDSKKGFQSRSKGII